MRCKFLIFITLSTYIGAHSYWWILLEKHHSPSLIEGTEGRRREGRRKTDMVHLAWTVPHIPLTEFPCYVSLWTFWLSDEKGAVELIVGEGCYVGHARQIMREETVKVWCLGGFGRIMR